MLQKSLTNVQLEILKLYSTDMSEEELIDLKKLLAENYAQKSVEEADKIWKEKGLSDSDMKNWIQK
jgi:predicted metal-binding transcription factor (methanogenesis marker protein 9)